MTLRSIALFAAAAAFIAAPALAHHSFAMFDHEKSVKISGTVKEFEFTNPHAWIHVTATDEKTGRAVEWSFEMGSVGQITAQGWKADTIKPGDKITVTIHPLKDGSRGGQYTSAMLADGRTLSQPGNGANDNVVR
jgi:uncharacterized protein DUF6152